MSKPNEKTQGLAPATAAPAGSSNLAVVQPSSATEAQTPHRDAHHGAGGLYTVVNGKRTRVAVTQPANTQKAVTKEAKK